MNRLLLALATVLCASLAACSNTPPSAQARAEFASSQHRAAEAAEAAGDLAQALNLRRSLLPLDPDNAATRTAVDELHARILQRSAAAVERGKTAYARGRVGEGDRWMLRALALQPGEATALASLRHQASVRAHARARLNSTPEQQNEPAPAASDAAVADSAARLQEQYQQGDYQGLVIAIGPAPTDTRSARLLHDAHVALALKARQRNATQDELDHLSSALQLTAPAAEPGMMQRIGELRQQISLRWYQQGTSLLQSDLGAAIAALEQSVAVDPDNGAAKLKLQQAQTLQRNLEKIQRSDSL